MFNKGDYKMETWYYEVVSIDGDYANLKRTDIASDDLKLVARALLPPEIMERVFTFMIRAERNISILQRVSPYVHSDMVTGNTMMH